MTKKDLHINILLKYLLPIYLLAILIFTAYRGIFAYHFYDDFLLLYKSPAQLSPILIKGFVKGLRYDGIVVSYLMFVPLIVLIVFWLLNKSAQLYIKLSKVYFILVFALVFALSCMDFPYFKYFWTHPTVSIFDWLGFGGTFGMLVQESSYYVYYLLYFVSLLLIVLACVFCGKWALKNKTSNILLTHRLIQGILFFVALVFCFVGTRGHLSIHPLGLNAAYFTDNKLVSDFCVNPAYHFVSYINDTEIDFDELMDSDAAIAKAQHYINPNPNSIFQNPLTRQIEADSTKQLNEYNIVLVFMESLSANLLNQEVDGHKLTPFLDSLTESSYYFENIYSSGVHTNVGVASTLISYPSRFNKHMMGRQPFAYKGIGTTLKSKGYYNLFFMPNEEVYDNMGLFLRNNGIDTIFSDNHYKKEDKANNFGVPDSFLFNFAIQEINKLTERPFFANILTVSNHPPYVVPNQYKKVSNRDEIAILSYVDASIAEFMQKASEQDWYSNTIFVFHGDHGKMAPNQLYSMPLSYNHIPLIIYSPALEDMPQRFSQFGGQVDIFPTVMGLLNQPYTNNTMGVDLLREKRPYMFFSSDTQLGCIDDNYFYIFNPKDKTEYLYDETKKDGVNIIASNREVADRMKEYALSMLVATNSLENNGMIDEY